MLVDNLANWRAHGQFPTARIVDFAANPKQFGAAVFADAEGFEPVCTAIDNVWNVAQRLDVVDDGGPTPEPTHLWEGRFSPGVGSLALERVDQRGFLTADVAPSAGMDVHLQVEVRAENALAEVAAGVAFSDCIAQSLDRHQILPADKNVGNIGTDGVGGEYHALDQLVRVALHQQAVFEGTRLHFIGVADQVLVAGCAGVAPRNKAPFHAGWKAGTAATAQVGIFYHRLTVVGRHLGERFAQSAIAVVGLIRCQICGVAFGADIAR